MMRYVSNTGISTCHNYRVILNKGERRSFRVRLMPVEFGRLMWRFRFTNTIDSTYADGAEARADMPGGRFRVLESSANGVALRWNADSFGPDGVYETEPAEIEVPEGELLTFEWTLEALTDECVLPATPDSRAECFSSKDGVSFEADDIACLPEYLQALRDVKLEMAFIGDSITQGVQTRLGMHEQWVARIAAGIDSRIAVRNLGLGYGRGADAGRKGAWLKKAAGSDIVNICFGVNDILHGSRDAKVLISDIKSAVDGLREMNPSIKIVLLTVPPFDMIPEDERNRQETNRAIRENLFGADAVFDFAALTEKPAPEDNKAIFGGHPDGLGGAAIAGDYLSFFWPRHRNALTEK